MIVATIILALYFWAYFADVKSIASALLVSDMAAVAAGASLVLGFVSYLWTPQKYIFWGAYSAYMLLVTTTAILIISTGGASSPFIALWMIVSIFAAVFGAYGLSPLFAAVVLFTGIQFIDRQPETNTLTVIILGGLLPLLISFVAWHRKPGNNETGEDRAYSELASELSQVAGKSEVVINAIADGVIALDNKGAIQLINPAAQQIIGWGKQDALSLNYKSVLKLTTRDDKEVTTANDPILKVLADNKEVTTDDLILLTSTGKKRQVAIVVSPIGQLGSGVIIVFRDITKEKAEEREQAEFISTASHEMRTPVASIEGYLGLALNPNTAHIDEKARDFINKAHESAQHLGRLFQDLLDVAKAEDGRMSNNPKVIDMVEFTQEIVDGFRVKAQEKGLRILFKPRPDNNSDVEGGERQISPVFYANVDDGHLREILSNLIDNAIKYTPRGDVTIDVNGDNDHIVVSVADSGIGIPKEDQVHLFQKFYRVDNSDTREIGGTGLGLYLSRRLAEAMDGRIWVESEFKQGSTFYLEIPRIDHEEAMRLIEAASVKKQEEISDVTINPSPLQTPSGIEIPTLAQAAPEVIPTPTQPAAPQPAVQPQPTPAPQYEPTAQPNYQPPQAPTSFTTDQYTHPITNHPNTPLVSIEQNPNQYIQQTRGGVSVPPRR